MIWVVSLGQVIDKTLVKVQEYKNSLYIRRRGETLTA